MHRLILALGLSRAPLGAAAQDAESGEKIFGKCKACHRIESPEAILAKGGKTGPNLFGVIGRVAGTAEGFNYSAGMQAVLAKAVIWDEMMLIDYLANPTEWVKVTSEDPSARSKMTFKLADETQRADVAAYLASFGSGDEDGD
jgi:cytochrome c